MKFQAVQSIKQSAIKYTQVLHSVSSSESEGEGSGISSPLFERRLNVDLVVSHVHSGKTHRKNDLDVLPFAQVSANVFVLSRQARDLHEGQIWHNANGLPISRFDTSR